MLTRIPLLATAVLLLASASPAQAPASGSAYVLQWNGMTLAKFAAERSEPAAQGTTPQQGNAASQPPAPLLVLIGGSNYPALSRWNHSAEARTVELVTCNAGRPASRATYYGAVPRALRVTPAGIEFQMSYAQSVVSATAGGEALCSQPPQAVAILFDRRFGRAWTVQASGGRPDVWTFQSKNDEGSAAYFTGRENTTVTVEIARDTYIVNYLGCEYQGVPQGNDITLRPAGRSPGACAAPLGVLHATIVR